MAKTNPKTSFCICCEGHPEDSWDVRARIPFIIEFVFFYIQGLKCNFVANLVCFFRWSMRCSTNIIFCIFWTFDVYSICYSIFYSLFCVLCFGMCWRKFWHLPERHISPLELTMSLSRWSWTIHRGHYNDNNDDNHQHDNNDEMCNEYWNGKVNSCYGNLEENGRMEFSNGISCSSIRIRCSAPSFVFQVFGILMLFYRICIHSEFIYIEIDILLQQMSLVRYTTI